MEKFPDLKQPTDYALYPGKMDHTSCACIKVGPSSFNELEQSLDNLINRFATISIPPPSGGISNNQNRIRHPVKGLGASAPATVQVSAAVAAAAATSDKHHKLKRENTNTLQFKGSILQKWLEDNEVGKDTEASLSLCQDFLNFRYIRPLDVESEISESFNPEMKYQFEVRVHSTWHCICAISKNQDGFKVYEPIMTKHDWELLLKGAKEQTFKSGDVIVREGDPAAQRFYYIVSGTCRIEKLINPDQKLNTSGNDLDKKPKEKRRSKSPTGEKSAAAAAASQSSSDTATQTKPQTIALNALHESETFGEVSFLFNAPASAYVIADTDVLVYVIEGRFVNLLFVKYPYIAGRFYHYLASVVARRLKRQETRL